jgi:alkylhydroperoxidase family enzyme
MPYIKQIPVDEATGLIKKQFEQELESTGHVWNIIHVMSIAPLTMKACTEFHVAISYGSSPLSRVQREMLATVTAKTLNCHY